MEKTMLEELKNENILFGLASNYPASGIIEAMCQNWDFVWLDGQHGLHSYNSICSSMQVARELGIHSVIRVPGHDYFLIGQYEDLAPSAIMIPMVNNGNDAREIVKKAKFPPLGQRSYGSRSAIDLYGREYYKKDILIIAQIETVEALRNIEEIAEIEGIDVLFFGPDDMKLSLDIPINTSICNNNELIKAAKIVADTAKKAGKFAGVVAADKESRRILIEYGYQVVVTGADSAFLRTFSYQMLSELREELSKLQVACTKIEYKNESCEFEIKGVY